MESLGSRLGQTYSVGKYRISVVVVDRFLVQHTISMALSIS